ncbi:hypothetical protein ACFLQY_02215 [Verrucomicrobiota bacterium]
MLKYLGMGSLLGALLVSGCATYQNIPVHGGGKRFEEEQRIVAAAAGRAVAQIDFASMRGKNVNLVMTAQETSGNAGSKETFGWSKLASKQLSSHIDGVSGPNHKKEEFDQWELGEEALSTLKYSFKPNFSAHKTLTHKKDLTYLQSVILMAAQCNGVNLVEGAADLTLTVFVDVLGTNRKTYDALVYVREDLRASCELTYYIKGQDNNVLVQPTQVSGGADYSEHSVLFTNINKRTRKVDSNQPLIFDTPADWNVAAAVAEEPVAEEVVAPVAETKVEATSELASIFAELDAK